MKQKRLFLMCGVPGSGKSTLVQNLIKDSSNSVHISRDAVRFSMVSENEPYFSKENAVLTEFYRQVNEAILDESIENVYIDATHISVSSRRQTLSHLCRIGVNEINAIYFDVSIGTALERNSYRTGRANVPESAIVNMFNNFVAPSYREGFHHIYQVNEKGEMNDISNF